MKERKSNIELLRIVAMLLIVLGHSASHGVHFFGEPGQMIVWGTGSFVNKVFSSLLLPGGAVGVGVFFMITGFFQVKKNEYSLKKTILECMFYGVLISIIFVLMFLKDKGLAGYSLLDAFYYFFVKTLFNPVSGGAWWYVSSYFMIMILSPLINQFIHKLSKNGMLYFIGFIFVIWYCISYLTNGTYIQLEKGLFFYTLGAYIRLHINGNKKPGYVYAIYFILAWITGAAAYYGYSSLLLSFKFGPSGNKLATDMLDMYVFAVTTPVCAYSLFMFFKNMNLGEIKVINMIAGTTFGIYLIHDSMILRPVIWEKLFKINIVYSKGLYPVYIIGIVLLIFVTCMVIDIIRKKVFEGPMIKLADKVIAKAKEKLYQ